MHKKTQTILLLVVAAVAVGGLSFWGGAKYASSKTTGSRANSAQRMGRFATGNNFIVGQIVSKDDQSITIKDRTGSSRIILYSTSTDVGKFVKGAASDLTQDETVMINGKTNSDGSITAQSIQIRPSI